MSTTPDDQDHVLQLSRRLVALHLGGIVFLIAGVLTTAVWISAEHDLLALESSTELVQSEMDSVRTRGFTLIKDYSIWNEGFEGIMSDDRDWLYSSIGSSVTEIGTFDMALLTVPGRTPAFGWVEGSPEAGETGLLAPDLLADILALVESDEKSTVDTRTLIAEHQGSPWIFAVARMIPVTGAPPGVAPEDLPRQIHGYELTQERLPHFEAKNIADGITLSAEVPPGMASLPVTDYKGRDIAHVVWRRPTPGWSTLQKVALPILVALGLAAAISGISSLYTVRSARRLESALHAAKAADRSKTEFISNVSHELRTPMNGVLGAGQLLQTTDLDAEQQELLGVLLSSANAQMSLISDLIDLSRIDAGRRKSEAHPFEPAVIVRQVADMMQVAAANKRIGLDVDCSDLNGVMLSGDSQAFRQILTNLAGNAVKFTETGNVTIRTATEMVAGIARLTVTVSDTGPGIPSKALPRIFERFYQVDSSMSRAAEGTGLGLAISQKLAHSLGGEIQVASEVGTGSTFRLVAPFEILSDAVETRDAA